MNVFITQRAKQGLREIGHFIAQDNPGRALSFIRELREACLGLADMPYAFQVVGRYQKQVVRRRPYGKYSIFYAVDGETVVVLHVQSGAALYDELLDTPA
jgi:toxin ParE1/3/4